MTDAPDLARIDAFVCANEEGQIFQRPAWLRAVEGGCGQQCAYLVAEDGAGAIAGVLPVTAMNSLLFGKSLVSTGFAVGGGLLGDAAAPSLAAELARWADGERIDNVELRGGADPGAGWTVHDDAHCGFVRDLAADEEAELLAIPRKQRAEVRRAMALGLDVSVGRDAPHRRAHYAVLAESYRNLGTPVFPRRLFEAMLDAFDDAEILTVSARGRPVASVLSFRHRGAIMPFWGGGTADARRLRANDAMYWALMGHARATGCTRFDFGRSKTGSGTHAFKKNWGFAPRPLRYFTRGAARAPRPTDARYASMIALWKRLPLALANLVGPPIARGLG